MTHCHSKTGPKLNLFDEASVKQRAEWRRVFETIAKEMIHAIAGGELILSLAAKQIETPAGSMSYQAVLLIFRQCSDQIRCGIAGKIQCHVEEQRHMCRDVLQDLDISDLPRA